ncbi:MAG: tRNA (adenosine(37)-N6)-threonylcarbamoyltransferase complex dimerization subunit type 1 TsaB [Candidatus Levybacteria bacterium]|nr:tRNA (adenosine(37)-N6)-threonylcarbamoyltransferase complex dimerization subunit type 1 TsaB [Candidatus Levybacteria bacterium]
MNTIHINTTSNKEIIIGLTVGKKEDRLKEAIGEQKAQIVLSLIDTLLKKHNLTVQDLDAIEVNIGPGSFTGLRVGISVANTLGTTLQVPINGQKPGVLAEPRYT